jgi:hypothetical protein
MFTRQELVTELPHLETADAPPLEVVELGHQDFKSPCSEQCIWAFRGLKRDFASELQFWVKTVQAQGWEGRQGYFAGYTQKGLCEPITAAEFARLVAEYSGSLRQPFPSFLRELDGFRSGMRMYADWNNVAVVAELADAFVAFYWSTTA